MPIVRPIWCQLLRYKNAKGKKSPQRKSWWLKVSTVCSLALAFVIVVDLARDDDWQEPTGSKVDAWSSPELVDQAEGDFETVATIDDVDTPVSSAKSDMTGKSANVVDHQLAHAVNTESMTELPAGALSGHEELKIVQTGFETVEAQPPRAVWLTGIIEEVTD